MSFESISSKPLHFFDVPETKDLKVTFSYNFFVPDEKIDESGTEAIRGNLSERFLRKGTADTSNLNSRVPRYVKLSFSIGDSKKKMLGPRAKSRELTSTREEITEALQSGLFVTEDEVSLSRFKSAVLGNQSTSFELENFMRLSLNKHVAAVEEASVQDAINTFSKTTKVSSTYISSKMVPPSLNSRPDNKKFSAFRDRDRKVKSKIQLNSSFAPMILGKSISAGTNLLQTDSINRYVESIEGFREATDFLVTEDESVHAVPAADLERMTGDSFVPEASVIGVLFEKKRVYGGKKYPMSSVLCVGENPSSAYDSQVAYGQTYEYTAFTLSKFRIPITTDDGRSYIQTIFVASKPSNSVLVTIEEDRAPEPPQDINYYFEFDRRSLYITWAPPVNPQRDVKYIQVFRRKSVSEPFELIANLDFDDSVLRNEPVEDIDESLTTTYSSMPTYFEDPEFGRDSSFIYSLVAVDARQISSPYSTQVRVSFDTQKNKIKKELVSYSGAPKQYPNWMLKENFFVDSMKDSSHGQVSIYFNPEAYTVVKGNGETFPAFYSKTIDPLSKYVFQFINTDRLLEKKFEVTIDDEIYKATLEKLKEGEVDDDE